MYLIFEFEGKKVFFDGKQLKNTLPAGKLLSLFVSAEQLKQTFNKKFRTTVTKGLDRLKGIHLAEKLDAELLVIERKCLSGTYRFTPYAQILQLKGRNKSPRVIGIPTIRDRLVLHQLKDVLAYTFPECVPKARANTLIHRISREITEAQKAGKLENVSVFGCDIQKFYDEIDHNVLYETLATRIKSSKVLRLVKAAIETPTVPRNYRREDLDDFKVEKGVPQGLAISNILAAIYLSNFDIAISSHPIKYYRYVDDVLIFGPKDNVEGTIKAIHEQLATLGLKAHEVGEGGKSHLGPIEKEFGYLGYLFCVPSISVRPATVERFLQRIIGKFSDYKHNSEWKIKNFKYLTHARLKEVFVAELNERITGAISGKKRYGWIAYFSEITDIALLARLDQVIAKFFKRLGDFGNVAPPELKTLVRSYFEMRYSPMDGYIQDYDKIVTLVDKMQFLVFRGRLDPTVAYSEDEIGIQYERYRNRSLSELEPDDGMLY